MKKTIIDARDYLRSPGIGAPNAVIQVYGAQIIPYTKHDGEIYFLLHQRPNGKIGAIGGACDILIDQNGNAVRYATIQETIQNEFWEETGHTLHEETWTYIDTVASLNKYNGKPHRLFHYIPKCIRIWLPRKVFNRLNGGYPDVHGIGIYFYTLSTYDRLLEYASGGGTSNEGTPVILSITELIAKKDYWFSNAAPIFEKLISLSLQ